MIQRTVRSFILTLSSLAASSPIEIITTTFILVTLTYFQLLQAIKGSEFFNIPSTVTATVIPPQKPIHLVRLSNPQHGEGLARHSSVYVGGYEGGTVGVGEDWGSIGAGEFRGVLESNALEGGYTFPSSAEKAVVVLVKQLTVAREDGEGVTREWERWLLNDVGPEVGGKKYTYQDLCFQCDTTLQQHPVHPLQSTLTLFLRPPTPDTPTLTYLNYISRLPPHVPEGSNSTFRLLPPSSRSWAFLPTFDGAGLFGGMANSASQSEKEEEDMLSGLRNVRWFAYAMRALVMRFYALAKVSCGVLHNRQTANLNRMPTLRIFLSFYWDTFSCMSALCRCSGIWAR
jgi:hydroxymethylglutaryl-CoA reductase (NADPH)